MNDDIALLRVGRWQQHAGLLHGFMGRRGGKSVGPYAGLNVSYHVGDDAEIVSRNVCDAKSAIGIHDGRVVTMKQVHGDTIVDVKDTKTKETGEADAIVTATPGVFLGVLTADCVPILFAAPDRRVAAAVHTGWRGTLAGIVVKTVEHLQQNYGIAPGSLEAAIGPAIGPCCYEVGEDVVEALLARWGRLAEGTIDRSAAKAHLDLRRLNQAILVQAGLPGESVYNIGPCTSCAATDYFSYRRQRGETGRQMSVIGWQG
jgi:YfiH family protein